ncbi:MAG TPA: hypothetical protein VMH40_08450 [Myxococcaceae bacterium]|nr:hypothetical protein [Myxococcaceae bacterium]
MGGEEVEQGADARRSLGAVRGQRVDADSARRAPSSTSRRRPAAVLAQAFLVGLPIALTARRFLGRPEAFALAAAPA